MTSTRTVLLARPLAVAAALCVFTNADAADQFGVVGIENATDTNIRLQHRWGDRQWTTDGDQSGWPEMVLAGIQPSE